VLAIYRRHQSPCKYTSRRFRNCKCPIWVQGSLRGEYVRRSLDLRSWEAASELVRGWEASGEVGVVKPEIPTVAEAVTKFIEDAIARHLAGVRIERLPATETDRRRRDPRVQNDVGRWRGVRDEEPGADARVLQVL
jgi:hypothetical protein